MITYEHLNLKDRYALLESIPYYYKLGVEIGVWQGWYTSHMINKTRMTVFGIDPWVATESYGDVDPAAKDFEPFKTGIDGLLWQEARYIHTIKSLKSRFPTNRWEILRSYSKPASLFFDNESIDFVYVDGEHTYDAVCCDMKTWWPKVKSGGILSGHDYNETNPGTKKAVNEFAEKNNLKFVITGTSPEKGDADAPSWVFIKG